MFLWRIMIETGFEIGPIELWQDEIAFGRMQIAGRRITPQCPLRFTCLLPSRQRESKFEEPGKRPQPHRLRKNSICLINGIVRWGDRFFFWFQQWQRNEWCTFNSPKWIRL